PPFRISRAWPCDLAPTCGATRALPPGAARLSTIHVWNTTTTALAGLAPDQFQGVFGEGLLELQAGVVGPGALAVEAEVLLPMRHRAARLALALVGQGEVVVGVGIGGDEAHCRQIR